MTDAIKKSIKTLISSKNSRINRIILCIIIVTALLLIILTMNDVMSYMYCKIAANKLNGILVHETSDKDVLAERINDAELFVLRSLKYNNNNEDAIKLFVTVVQYKYEHNYLKQIHVLQNNNELVGDKIKLKYEIAMRYILLDEDKGYEMLIEIHNRNKKFSDKYELSCIIYSYLYDKDRLKEYELMYNACNSHNNKKQ